MNVRKLIAQLILLWLGVQAVATLATACASEPASPTTTSAPPTPTASAAAEGTRTPAKGNGQPFSLDQIATVIVQRTPMPTPTPGPVLRLAEEIAVESGLADRSLFGFPVTNWINLGISILFFVLFVFLGVKFLFSLLERVVRRTKTRFDDEFLDSIERELKWFIVIVLAGATVTRLGFWGNALTLLLGDLFFVLAMAVLYIIALRLVAFAARWYREHGVPPTQRVRLDPLIEMVKRLGYLFVSMLALSSILSHFGIEVTLLSAVVLFAAVVIGLGANAAISDAVSGFLILVSQPFRVGDAIFIKEVDTRGDVVEIGIRATQIRTHDGREVIVPNSLIAASQVINYTFPDPDYRVEIDFLTYGSDIDQLQQVIQEAVRGVEGVLPDRPVDVLYLSFGGSSREIRVRWWVDHINNRTRVLSQVNMALDRAFDKAGIDTPNLTYDLNLKAEGGKGRDGDGANGPLRLG
jgi:small-conductance mechanosensitive channel